MKNNTSKSLKRNFLYNLLYQILIIIFPFITAPYVTRILTAVNLGAYTYAQTIQNYFLLFGMLGFSISGNRAIARCRDSQNDLNRTFSSVYLAQLFSMVIASTAYFAVCWIFQWNTIYYILGLTVLSGIFDVSWLYYGLEEFKITSIVNAASKIASLFCIFVFVNNISDLYLYAFIMSANVITTNVIFSLLAIRRVKVVKTSLINIIFCEKDALVLFLPVIAASVYKLMDKIMIGVMTGDMVGISNYYYAEQLISVPSGIVIALSNVILPRMSHNHAVNNHKEQNKIISSTLLLSCFLSCAISFGLAGISTVFVPLYLGNEYIPCGNYVVLMSITSIFTSWTAMMRTLFLIPRKKDRIYITSVVAGAIINFLLNSTLIGVLGIYGAIIGIIAAEMTVMLIQTVAVMKEENIKRQIVNIVPFIVFGIIMFGACRIISWLFGSSWHVLMVQIVVGAAIYLILSFVYIMIFHRNIIKMIKIKRRSNN